MKILINMFQYEKAFGNMDDNENIIKIYSGTEASVIMLRARLEEAGIPSLVKNDSSFAFLGTSPEIVDLYIEKKDVEDAFPIIKEFKP
jgi:Putative prokaryotic signal transducing protein